MNFELQITASVNPDISAFIQKGLEENARRNGIATSPPQELVVCMHENGALVGALEGHTSAGWMFIRGFYVDKQYQGIGTRILKAAEQEAIGRGCREACVLTRTAQAFYEKNGYEKSGELPYPPGPMLKICRKQLGNPQS